MWLVQVSGSVPTPARETSAYGRSAIGAGPALLTVWRTVNIYLSSTAKVSAKTWPLPFAHLSETGLPGASSAPLAVNSVLASGTVTPSPLQPKPPKYASLVPRGDSKRIGGEFLSTVSLYLVSVRSSIRAPFKLIEPSRSAVRIAMRGLSARTTASGRTAPVPVVVGPAVVGPVGVSITLVVPATILVAGGLARGNSFADRKFPPSRMIAASTANSTKFRVSSFT